MTEHRCHGRFGADHPSLPGHFPGHPVIPGVVLLDWVQAAARRAWRLPSLSALPNIKFLAPLLPEVEFQAVLTLNQDKVGFRIETQGRLLAQGLMIFAARAK